METQYQAISDLFDSEAYDPDFGIRQKKLRSGSRRGKKGSDLVKWRNEKGPDPYNLSQEELQQRLIVLQALLQPDRRFKTFIPAFCLNTFFEEIMRGTWNPSAYKGVSYNPQLSVKGEKLDNFDFFSWAKRVQETIPDFELTVLDASPYQALNEIGEMKAPRNLREDQFPEWFYGIIKETVERRQDLAENCRIREASLRAMMEISGVRGRVVSILKLIQDADSQLMESLIEANIACNVTQEINGRVSVGRFAEYRRYDNSFSKTYTPAVVAEALYFRKQGTTTKLGPTSEVAFDRIISEMNPRQSFIWYNRPFERRKNAIYLQDSEDQRKIKLAEAEYAAWLNDVLSPFSTETSTRDQIADISEKMRAKICRA